MADAARRLPGAADLHATIGDGWPNVLEALGIGSEFLRNRHMPCPSCGGTDRYRFDNKRGRGDYFCNGCGAGDGFKLLMGVHGWSFVEALRAVAGYLGYDTAIPERQTRQAPRREPERAQLTARGRDLLKGVTSPELVPDVAAYLASRKLWPLNTTKDLRAHVGVDYFRRLNDGEKAIERIGRFPAMVGVVRDQSGEAVTVHTTYLENGAKLDRGDDCPSRKLLSPVTGRVGCAVRLMPITERVLAVAEGIETALSASVLHDNIATWSCLNASLLAKFVPPADVHRLIVFADKDIAGLEAALKLTEELDGRCAVETRIPPGAFKDWNDVLRGPLQ